MRRLVLPLFLVVSGLALAQQSARPAVEKFHEAARLFVAGDTAAAAREARAGLAISPRDPSLQALLAAIEQRPPPQPSGGGGDDQQPPPPPEDPGDDGQGSEGEEERPRPEQEPREQPGDGERDEAPTRPSSEPPGDARDGGPPPPQPGRMTRAEAEALLRALGADERRLLRARRQNAEDRHFENDW